MAADRSATSQRDRRVPFGIQLLLAAGIVLLILIVAGQFTVVPTQREVDAVRAIEKLGCRVEWYNPPDEVKTPFGTYRRRWFTWILGEKYFSKIVRVRIQSVDDDLAGHFTRLGSYGEAVAFLRGASTTDASVERLAKLPRLRVADLAWTEISDAAVGQLAAATDMEVLDLEHTRVTDQAVASLAAMPKLRKLNLEGTHVSDRAVEQLKKAKPELTVAWATAPSEPERAAAARLAAIRGVVIRPMRSASGAIVYAAAIQWGLARPQRVPVTSEIKVQTGAEVLTALLRLPHLARLKLYGGFLSAEDLDDLARLTMLRELYLEDSTFILAPEHIARLTGLRKLILVRVAMANRELELIASLPKLEDLTLRWPQPWSRSTDDFWMRSETVAVNDDGLECLRRTSQLRRLVLRVAHPPRWEPAKLFEITDAGLAYIKSLPNLEFLDLSGTKVTPAGLLGLQGMAKLRELVILGIPFDAEQEAKLRRALPQTAIRTGPLDRADAEPRRLELSPYLEANKGLMESLREPDPIP